MNKKLRELRHATWQLCCVFADWFGVGKWRAISAVRAFIGLGIAFALFAFYPRILNNWFDFNLDLVRAAGKIPTIGDHMEAFLRFFNAERLLVIMEVGFIIVLISWIRRQFHSKPRDAP